MDPNACFSELLMALSLRHYDEAREHAENLDKWLSRGGFAPGGDYIPRESIAAFVTWVLCDLNQEAEAQS